MSAAAINKVLDPSIPLCFDTNPLYPPGKARKLLDPVRGRFPTRDLLIPVWVIAETTRRLWLTHKERYNHLLIDQFLDDPLLALKVVAFDREVACPHWLDVVSVYENDDWKQRERSRFADHGIYATARARAAILVTDDKELRERMMTDGYLPGTITKEELLSAAGPLR